MVGFHGRVAVLCDRRHSTTVATSATLPGLGAAGFSVATSATLPGLGAVGFSVATSATLPNAS